MTDKDLAEKQRLEERLERVVEALFLLYLLRFKAAVRLGRAIPGGEFSKEDFKFSLERHYRLTQTEFRDRVFPGIDPVNQSPEAQVIFDKSLEEWRKSVSEERASVIAETNAIQGRDALDQARKALSQEQGSFSSLELSTLAGALLKKKFDDRQKLIAITETQAASESTKQLKTDAILTSALAVLFSVERKWNCRFENSRPSHEAANGQTRLNDAKFSVGSSALQYPGDVSAPPSEYINCRCWLTSRIIPLGV